MFSERSVTMSRNALIAVLLGLTGLALAVGHAIHYPTHWGIVAVPVTGLAIVYRLRAVACSLYQAVDKRLGQLDQKWTEAFEMGREVERDAQAARQGVTPLR